MRIRDILKAKGLEIVIVGPDDPLATVSRRIAEKGKGLAVVCGPNAAPLCCADAVVCIAQLQAPGKRRMAARDVMNTAICTCGLDDTVEQALDAMAARGIRHLPVVEDDAVRGIVNIKDLLEARFAEARIDLEEMRRYIFGVGYR